MGPRLSSEAMCPGVAGTDHTPARKSMAALDKHVVAGGVGVGGKGHGGAEEPGPDFLWGNWLGHLEGAQVLEDRSRTGIRRALGCVMVPGAWLQVIQT